MSCLLKLKWHISLKNNVVHTFIVQPIRYEHTLLLVISSLLSCQLQTTCNVLLRHDKEMFICDWTFRHCQVEFTCICFLRYYQLFLDFWIVKTKPAIFVLLNSNSFHFVIYLQNRTFEWLSILTATGLSSYHAFKCCYRIRLPSTILLINCKSSYCSERL